MSRLLRSRSGTESPRSLDNMRNRQVSSPMRTSGSVSHESTLKLNLSEGNILLISYLTIGIILVRRFR